MTNTLQNTPKNGGVVKTLTIRDRLNSLEFRNTVSQVLPKCLTPDRFLRVAILATTKTPKLLNCDQASFFNALMTLSQYGIEPDGRRAHLIPYGTTCQLIIDYKGLAELAMRSGIVSCLHADIVCENDDFEFDCGQLKRHRIDFKQPRGPAYAVYALCRFKDGAEKAEVMTVEEVEAVRKRSKAGHNGPWVTDWNEMAKKTVFRRMSKWLPLSPEFRDAVEHDDEPVIDTKATTAPTRSLVGTTEVFELPVPTEETVGKPNSDDGDHGPQNPPAPPASWVTSTEARPSTFQNNLEKEIAAIAVDFSTFQKWCEESGSLPDASSIGSFEEIKNADAKRLLTALRGEKSRAIVVQQMQSMKGAML